MALRTTPPVSQRRPYFMSNSTTINNNIPFPLSTTPYTSCLFCLAYSRYFIEVPFCDIKLISLKL